MLFVLLQISNSYFNSHTTFELDPESVLPEGVADIIKKKQLFTRKNELTEREEEEKEKKEKV
ncbi:hypothetical protein [Arenibacter certesii]|uniref:hypothetical protein n=1 Tax=Arenibacter certesii TaxID=228955 RepID=UPI0004101114|nr:hypothetical protein [Arenibacter certesii]